MKRGPTHALRRGDCQPSRPSNWARPEQIRRGLRHARLGADVRGVAAGWWRDATFGLHVLHEPRPREGSTPLGRLDREQEPWMSPAAGAGAFSFTAEQRPSQQDRNRISFADPRSGTELTEVVILVRCATRCCSKVLSRLTGPSL